MAVKLFILGRPGSGKSTVARKLAELARHKGWSPVRINDYHILHELFRQEMLQPTNPRKRFRPAQHDGFDVVDFSVLDDVLRMVEKRAREEVYLEQYLFSIRKLILIEFARNDYGDALSLFNAGFLRDAYFLFIHTDVDTCVERVNIRTAYYHSLDDHFVSDEIIRYYYNTDLTPQMIFQLKSAYQLNDQQVKVIKNTGSLDEFLDNITKFFGVLFAQTTNRSRKTRPLLETSSCK